MLAIDIYLKSIAIDVDISKNISKYVSSRSQNIFKYKYIGTDTFWKYYIPNRSMTAVLRFIYT